MTRVADKNKAALVAAALGDEWVACRFGHYKKRVQRGEAYRHYRLKMQDISVRLEVSVTNGEGKNSWVRVATAYYTDLTLMPCGRVSFSGYKIGKGTT